MDGNVIRPLYMDFGEKLQEIEEGKEIFRICSECQKRLEEEKPELGKIIIVDVLNILFAELTNNRDVFKHLMD